MSSDRRKWLGWLPKVVLGWTLLKFTTLTIYLGITLHSNSSEDQLTLASSSTQLNASLEVMPSSHNL